MGEKIMSVNCVVINRERNIAEVFDEVKANIAYIYRCFVSFVSNLTSTCEQFDKSKQVVRYQIRLPSMNYQVQPPELPSALPNVE